MEVKIGPYVDDADAGEREIVVKIDNYDTWNLDSTLALVILPALRQFAKNPTGYPGDFSGMVGGQQDWEQQQSFEFYIESAAEYSDYGAKVWKQTLNKMIWSFEQLVDKDWEKNYIIDPGVLNEDKYASFENYYKVKPRVDREGEDRHREKIQEGLNLFAKYYQNLWD